VTFDQIPFQEISSAAIWIPLILAGLKLETGDLKVRLFFLFLLFGAGIDAFGWIINMTTEDFRVHSFFQMVYLFYEMIFFVWLCTGFLKTINQVKIKRVLCLIFFVFFLIRLSILIFGDYNPYERILVLYVFDAVCLVTISFLSAFALLHLAEEMGDSLMSFPWFWILSGIFFYSFGTFFIDLLASTNIVGAVWRLRNVVNVIQYGFFVVGLLRMRNDQ